MRRFLPSTLPYPLAALLVLASGLQLAAQVPGSRDTRFALVAGTDGTPLRLAFAPDGKVYAGGSFTNYGGTGRGAVARLNLDGTVDTTFNLPPVREIKPPVVINGQVFSAGATNPGTINAMAVRTDGRLALIGSFTHIGSTPLKDFALIDPTGTPVPFTPNIGKTAEIATALAGPDNHLWVGGEGSLDPTTTDARTGRLMLARLRPDGTRDPGVVPPRLAELGYATAVVTTLHPGPGGSVYALVSAATTNLQLAFAVMRFTGSGALDTTFADGGRANAGGLVQAFSAADSQGRLYLSGSITWRGTTLTRRVNRISPDGTLDTSFVAAAQGAITSAGIALQPDGRLLLINAGDATVIRLNLDGSRDAAYANAATTPAPASLSALTLAVGPDGAAYCGGFEFVGRTLMNGVFRVHGDPASAPAFAIQPTSQTNTLGARTRFAVNATGLAPITYQWRRNGVAIPGATDRALVLATTTETDAADYDCVAANALGSVTSSPARLELVIPTAGAVHLETDVPTGTDGNVEDLQHAGSGGILVAGPFGRIHDTPARGVARLLDVGRRVDPVFDSTRINVSLGIPAQVLPLDGGRALLVGDFVISTGGRSFTGSVRLAADGSLDSSWYGSGTGGSGVGKFAAFADGRLLVADRNWNKVQLPAGVARLSPDGVPDPEFRTPVSFPDFLTPVALPDGGALVAGRTNPSAFAPTLPSGVLRFLPNGALDPDFHVGPIEKLSSAILNQFLRLDDGRILLAGDFMLGTETGPRRVAVLRLLPNGQPDPEFNPVPSLARTTAAAHRIAVQADGRILVAPRFGPLVRLWPNGVADPEFAPGHPTFNDRASELGAVLATPANDILVGGSFNRFNQLPRTNLVRLSGGPLRPIPPAPGITSVPLRTLGVVGNPLTLEVVPAGEGPFQFQWRRNERPGSSTFVEIAGATNATLTLASPQATDSGLYQVVVVNPGGAVVSPRLTVLFRPDPVIPGTADVSFASGGFRGILTSQPQLAEPAPDGSIFASFGTEVRRLHEDGTHDPSFVTDPALFGGPLPDGGISAVRRQQDGRILVAGRFRNGAVARLLPDGALDPDFVRTNSYTGGFQSVPWAIGLQSDGRILIGGTFENFAGRARPGLVRLLPDGRWDESFQLDVAAQVQNPVRTLPGSVITIQVLRDDRYYVSGGFTHLDGVPRSGVARVLADGTVDPSFVPPVFGSSILGDSGGRVVYGAGPVTPAGGIYIFGRFQLEENGPVYSALRLHADGSLDNTFRVTTDFPIHFGAVQTDGKLVITGQFTRLNGAFRTGFARLHPDGSTDTSWSEAMSFGSGLPLVLLPDGNLLADSIRVFTGAGPAPEAGAVEFTLRDGALRLAWPAGHVLQRTPRLFPAEWTDLPVSSPYSVPTAAPGEFFRLRRAP